MTRGGRIELGDVTQHNIKQLKKLNSVVFPVAYNDKFYRDILDVGELAKLAYYNDIVVGAVCCRVDKSDNSRRLYIMTLGCLAPYRRLGIGTKMLEHWILENGIRRRKFVQVSLEGRPDKPKNSKCSNTISLVFVSKFSRTCTLCAVFQIFKFERRFGNSTARQDE